MAVLTIQQRPSTSDVHGAFEQLMYVLTSTDQAANFKYRYIADLYVNVGGVSTLVSRVRVYPNGVFSFLGLRYILTLRVRGCFV